MDKNAFRTELDQVRFTPAGREALTEALMSGERAPARRPSRIEMNAARHPAPA